MHSDEKRKFTETDWSSGERGSGQSQNDGGDGKAINSGVFHNYRFYQIDLAVDNLKMFSYCAAPLRKDRELLAGAS